MISANDGQEIISMTYEEYNYRLVTLCEEYVCLFLFYIIYE